MNAPVTADLARVPDGLPDSLADSLTDSLSREAAFEDLYEAQHGFVWRCARRLCVAEAEVDDVVQDVFVVAYRRLDRLDPDVAASTWLFGILRNVVRNRARGQGRHQRRLQALAETIDAREQERCRFEARVGERLLAERRMTAFLRELDPAQREAFVLAELEGYTGKEIAAALGINANTAASRLRLARRAFCRHFELEPKREAVREATAPLREHPIEPSPEVRAHSLGLVLAAVARPVAWTGPIGSMLAALSGKLGGAGSWVAATLVAGGLAVGTWVIAEPARGPDARAVSASVAASGSASQRGGQDEVRPQVGAVDAPAEPMDEADEADEADEPVPVIAPAPRKAAREREQVSAAKQLQLARAALVAGDARSTLALLDAIPSADASLWDARVATRVAALCKLDEGDRAREQFEALRARMPDAAVLQRIDHACW